MSHSPSTARRLVLSGTVLSLAAGVFGFPPFVNWPSADPQTDCRGFLAGSDYRIGLGSPMQTPPDAPRHYWNQYVADDYEGASVAWEITGNGLDRIVTLVHLSSSTGLPQMPTTIRLPGLESGNIVWNGSPMRFEVLEGYCVLGTPAVLGSGTILTESDSAISEIRVLTHVYPTGTPLAFKARVTALWGLSAGGYPTPSEYLGVLLSAWGGCAADSEAGARADLNGDGEIGPADLGLLLSDWSS